MNQRTRRAVITLAIVLLVASVLGYFLWSYSRRPGRDTLLSWMPGTAQTVLFVDLLEMRRSPFFAELVAWAPKPATDPEYTQFRNATGFDYEKDLDCLAVSFERHSAERTFFAVAAGRFDREKIKAYVAKAGSTVKQADLEIFSFPVTGQPQRVWFTFLRNDLVAFTNASSAQFARPASTPESADWHARFERLAGSPVFAILRNDGIKEAIGPADSPSPVARRATGGLASPQLSFLVQQLQWITLAGKPDNDRLRAVVEGETSDETKTQQLADLLNGVVLLVRAGLESPAIQQQVGSGARQSYIAVLKSVDISRIDRGDTKSVRLMFDVTSALLKSTQPSVPATAITK